MTTPDEEETPAVYVHAEVAAAAVSPKVYPDWATPEEQARHFEKDLAEHSQPDDQEDYGNAMD